MIWKMLDAMLYRRWHRSQIRNQRRNAMHTVTDQTPELTPPVLVVENPPYAAHTRTFDFNKGDLRFFEREAAIAVARLRVKDRGCRQQVRQVDRPHGDDHLIPRWLVQDI